MDEGRGRGGRSDGGVPRPGEPFEPAGELPVEAWWRAVADPIAHPWRRPWMADTLAETSKGDLDLAGER